MAPHNLCLKTARLLLCFCAFLAGSPASGLAQDVLTLDRCIALATENHPQTHIAENAVQAAEFSLSEVGKTALPQVSATALAMYAPVPPKFGYDPALTDGGQVAGQIVVRQSVYDGGIRGLTSDQLRLDVERAKQERSLTGLEITFAVRQAYSEALRAQEEVALRRESLTQLTGYGDLVRRLHTGGTASYADVLKSEMQTLMASLALEKAREVSASSRLSLSEVIGLPIDSTTQFSGPATDVPRLGPDLDDLAQNLELNIARLAMKVGQLDIQRASHERFPVISLVADAGYLSSGDNLRLPGADRLNAWGYSIGVGLEIPILNWGATGLRVQQKELAADDLKLRIDLLQRSISTEIRKTALQVVQAQTRLAVLRETVRKAEQNFLLTKSKYVAGGALALEVFAAQQLLTDTRLDELQTGSDIRVLAARLERLTAHQQTSTGQ